MNFIVLALENSILNKKNLRKAIQNIYPNRILIRFFISHFDRDLIYIEVLTLE
jgi:hypothetical protein